MTAKMRKKSPTTMETLAMDASDSVTDLNTSIMPGLRVSVLQQWHTLRLAEVSSIPVKPEDEHCATQSGTAQQKQLTIDTAQFAKSK